MPTIIRRNERSWAISMISDINIKLQSLNLRIIRAGGETTISTGHQSMFPDVLLYGDGGLGNHSVVAPFWNGPRSSKITDGSMDM